MNSDIRVDNREDAIPFVSIIILNWNGRLVTDKCLYSLFNVTKYPFDRVSVTVIDNGSTDDSFMYLTEKYQNKIDLIHSRENLGFIKGCNLGIERSLSKHDPQYILLLNNDIEIIQDNWLEKLIKVAENDELIGIVGPKLLFPDGKIQWSGRPRESNVLSLILQTTTARLNPGFGEDELKAKTANFTGDVNTISGACMLIKTDVIRSIGLLDISLYPAYQEDVEYSFRVWKNGYRAVYCGDVKLIHYEGYSIDSQKSNELKFKKMYWAMRNSMIVSRRYFGYVNYFIFGLPIYIFNTFFDIKNKSDKLSIFNIKFKNDIRKSLTVFLNCLVDANKIR